MRRDPTLSEFADFLADAAEALTEALNLLADVTETASALSEAAAKLEGEAWARMEVAEQRLRALSDMATAALQKEHNQMKTTEIMTTEINTPAHHLQKYLAHKLREALMPQATTDAPLDPYTYSHRAHVSAHLSGAAREAFVESFIRDFREGVLAGRTVINAHVTVTELEAKLLQVHVDVDVAQEGAK